MNYFEELKKYLNVIEPQVATDSNRRKVIFTILIINHYNIG